MLRFLNNRHLGNCYFLCENGINKNAICKKSTGLSSAYVPNEVENINRDANYFVCKGNKSSNETLSMILPPPNITGDLHLGHALTIAIQDVIIRWNEMRGANTLWIPGMDHAGIATQVVVEKKLWKERQLTRHDLGRELFVNEIWKWKDEKADKIRSQLNILGASLNWEKELFTMDAIQSTAVTSSFVKLYENDLIYRSNYLVNWSCVLQSAISDIEVEHLQVYGPTFISVPGYRKPVEFGMLNKFAYKLCESDDEIIVSTTRPETLFGDVAVAVNPKDDRYTSYIGRNLWHPFRKEAIPIISDDTVDPEFGTGAVKITPAHDQNDFDISKRHNLNVIQVIDENGKLTKVCGKYEGMSRFDVRNLVIEELAKMELLRGRQHHEMTVPICSRSKDVIEFLVKPQWFVKCQEMASRALEDVKMGNLIIEPIRFEKTWCNWLENIRDWCISRQLWWGHRVPAFTCHVRGETKERIWVAAESPEVAASKAASLLSTTVDNVVVKQDEDVLDTWFSSALLPFSTFGWPQQTEDLSKYYPLSLMETGHDILFFWVARMVMLGTQLTGKLPFKKILLHGIVCDEHGKKMSKSLGNVIAPEDVINGATLQDLEGMSRVSHALGILSQDELNKAIQGLKKMFPEGIPECGADALRFTLCSHNIKNHFINFNVQECKINKFFGNKIYQSVKFTNKWMENVMKNQDIKQIEISKLQQMDKWILSRLSYTIDIVNESLHKYDFHVTTLALKNFLYYDFCDVYLETTKRGLQNSRSEIASGHCYTLTYCLDNGLRCLAPFMPKLAQHLHENLYLHPSIISSEMHFPQNLPYRNLNLEDDVQTILDVVIAIRRIKNIFNVSFKHKPKVCLVSESSVYENYSETVEDLISCDSVTFTKEIDTDLVKDAISDSVASKVKIYLFVPEELRKSFERDVNKLEEKRDKLMNELEKIQKIISTYDYNIKASEYKKTSNLKKITTLQDKLNRIDYMKSFCRK